MKKALFFFLAAFAARVSLAQETFPVNGVHDVKPGLYAFTNATIISDPQTRVENATLLIRGEHIEEVGTSIKIPAGTVVTDLKGKYIYPSLIDAYTTYGMSELKRPQGNEAPQFVSNKKGPYNWNQAVKPEIDAKDIFIVDTKKAEELRNLGFGSVLSFQKDGIFRGTSCFVTLNDKRENEVIINGKTASHYSFNKGSSTQDYPSSLMGSIALLRQTFYDAQWYQDNEGKAEYNISLDAINRSSGIPKIFEIDEEEDVMRADKVGDEFGIPFIIKAMGAEYQLIKEVKKSGTSFILPLNFNKAYDVEDPLDAMNVSLAQMKHWELAPGNAAAMEKEGISFALTTDNLESAKDFWANLRLAIDYGLSENQALKALTQTPAEMLKVSDKVGTLAKGKLANFIITSGNLFKKETKIYENWVQGTRYVINDMHVNDLRATYSLEIEKLPALKLEVAGELYSNEATVKLNDTIPAKATLSQNADMVNFYFSFSDKKKPLISLAGDTIKGDVRLSGYIASTLPMSFKGNGVLPDGTPVKWVATLKEIFKEKDKKPDSAKRELRVGEVVYPFIAYGWKDEPVSEKVLIKNATVWTNEKDGKLENTDVLMNNGKIERVGKNLQTTDAKIIDGTGKHLTPGIIDEHSHIAIRRGVNEGTQAVSAEVRIGDEVTSQDINIYRQLSGGVTTSQLLHGSANPIGGQSAIIKLRWGRMPEAMKLENADGFIKFALGENVKQSNWGDRNTVRFPQTRMGVEQVHYDAFTRAKEYMKAWDNYNNLPAERKAVTASPRKDLELETLVEILNKKRFITCHSYVQSEINMLMHVADSMGFKVNTFTHILEGYKVADKMKKHGVSASTFADWWAYKYEVIDAIPYNAAILTKMGVNTSVNSDDAEMGRRLNQEAAKAVKYGGLSEEEALKLVTLNPAKMLHIANRVGSIRAGKDADVILWSGHPLSIYTKAEKTFVDGIPYFDRERDMQMREEIRIERARLVQKMLDAKNKGDKTQKPALSVAKLYHCDDTECEVNE